MQKLVIGLVAFILIAPSVMAQEAPAPRNAPRTPVHRQSIAQEPPPREVTGPAIIVDAERLRIGDTEMRLFGVVPPQLSASFGPQARAVLDQATGGKTVDCLIRDRDHDGHFLATCRTDAGDLGLALLQRGLAVTARGSLAGTEWAQPSLAAESAAVAQKIGLWSVGMPGLAAVPLSPVAEPTQVESVSAASGPIETKEPLKAEKFEKSAKGAVEEVKVGSTPVAPLVVTALAQKAAALPDEPTQKAGFIASYQILIAGLLMLITALGIISWFQLRRIYEKREDLRALAAALRGELMAARAVCQARLKTIMTEADDRAIAWPRIRATLYQAYVGRIGELGAELARQIASIYGQTSDYAAYYASVDDGIAMPKRQALDTLVQHIEAVLPRLGGIEQTGIAPRGAGGFTAPSPVVTVMPASVNAASTTPSSPANYLSASSPPTVTPSVAAKQIEAPIKAAPDEKTDASPPNSAKAAAARASGTDKNYNRAASPIPLWKAMRNFTRDKFADKPPPHDAMEDQFPDYATMLEDDIGDLSFADNEGEDSDPSGNVTKFRA